MYVCCVRVISQPPPKGDVVQVDTWIAPSGKHCVRRDSVFRDYNTGEILTRASSCYVRMNKQTRKLSKLPDEVRAELETYYVDAPHAVDEDTRKLPKLTDSNADFIQYGLTPSWSDLDVNQHVNNVKYVGWILQNFLVFGYARTEMTDDELRTMISNTLTCRIDKSAKCGDKIYLFLYRCFYHSGQYNSQYNSEEPFQN